MKRELFAFAVVLLILVVFPTALFGYQALRTHDDSERVVDLIANAPANGGWQPDTIRVNVGERVRLRISSPDVVHGFAVPALGILVDEILPGHVVEVEFTAFRAGRYPFACTRWCSPDHWRMRGGIEVVDPANPHSTEPTSAPPLYQRLGIDIDAQHPAASVPTQRPSAARGAALELHVAADWRVDSPSRVFSRMRGDPAFQAYDDAQLWDAIALAYEQAAGDESIARGEQLYGRDCAACHGESGKGDGPAGLKLPGLAVMYPQAKRGPADLTNPSLMLGASDALLQGKILRGGMGTGMPEWGSLYSETDMWDVVHYIRSFVFDYH